MVLHLNMDIISLEKWGVEHLGAVESMVENTLSYAENKTFFKGSC